jgi:hypothetical protein
MENEFLIKYSDVECYVARIQVGDTAGYHPIKLVYPSDLICNAGEAFTSCLDKIN